jgi:hypothetical protein
MKNGCCGWLFCVLTNLFSPSLCRLHRHLFDDSFVLAKLAVAHISICFEVFSRIALLEANSLLNFSKRAFSFNGAAFGLALTHGPVSTLKFAFSFAFSCVSISNTTK